MRKVNRLWLIIACIVSVELRNWKPIPLDSVTDDFSATVEQILGSLASFITVRIRLSRYLLSLAFQCTHSLHLHPTLPLGPLL